MLKKFLILLIVFAVAVGSFYVFIVVRNKIPNSPVVARVGNSFLTLDDVHSSMPPQYSEFITREQNINYVRQWIDTELMYREAVRRKIHREEKIERQLVDMKKDLLCAELISRSALDNSEINITEDMIKKHFNENRDSYLREQNVFRFAKIMLEDYGSAWRIRNLVTQDNFFSLVAQHSKIPPENSENVSYVMASEIPEDIVVVLGGLRVGGTTAPLKYEGGYSIIRLLDKQPAGTHATIDEVHDEIIHRLSIEIQKRKITNLLDELRMKTEVTYNFELLP